MMEKPEKGTYDAYCPMCEYLGAELAEARKMLYLKPPGPTPEEAERRRCVEAISMLEQPEYDENTMSTDEEMMAYNQGLHDAIAAIKGEE
jgi:hypothetical protein